MVLDGKFSQEYPVNVGVPQGRKWLFQFNARKTQMASFDWSNNTGAIDVKIDEKSVLEEKSSFKMLWLTFLSILDWGSYIISIAKPAYTKTGASTRSMKFLSPEVALVSVDLPYGHM